MYKYIFDHYIFGSNPFPKLFFRQKLFDWIFSLVANFFIIIIRYICPPAIVSIPNLSEALLDNVLKQTQNPKVKK